MKNLIFISVLLVSLNLKGAYTEFYCDFTNGDNLNSGSTTNTTATGTYTSAIVANGWNSATGVFTVAAGNPITNNIPLLEWASVYVTAGATKATYVAQITATNATTITVSLVAKSGTAPATDATGGTTIKIGGVWKGPNAAVSFPFGFVQNTMTNINTGIAFGLSPRVNLRNNATYAITAVVTNAIAGPIVWQGMTSVPGDLGKATIDCATSGAGVGILTGSGINNDYVDLIISNSGATSGTTTDGFLITGAEVNVIRCVVHDVRRDGFGCNAISVTLVECEAYLCNKSNTTTRGGFDILTSPTFLVRCISHDNAGSNNHGFSVKNGSTLISCIADTCGKNGFDISSVAGTILISCDAYNNTGSGVDLSVADTIPVVIQNCNFIKNGAWGINSSGAISRNGLITNCGFGVGTQVNTSGDINTTSMGAILISGSVSYPTGLTPWVAPATGDFRINLSQAKAVGVGTFTETQSSYSGTIGYPDIGAAQHRPAVLSYPFSN